MPSLSFCSSWAEDSPPLPPLICQCFSSTQSSMHFYCMCFDYCTFYAMLSFPPLSQFQEVGIKKALYQSLSLSLPFFLYFFKQTKKFYFKNNSHFFKTAGLICMMTFYIFTAQLTVNKSKIRTSCRCVYVSTVELLGS